MNTLSRIQLAQVVASYLPMNSFVNLGIGAPTTVGDYVSPDAGIMLHSENGILNIGPKPAPGDEDYDLINAGKTPITLGLGGSYFDTSLSFAMMRGGHLDIAILGAFQVSGKGDLANWTTGADTGAPPAVGGAIDLAVGAKAIWVMMDHTTKEGAPRIVRECSFPLTAAEAVDRIFTNIAIIDVNPDGLYVQALLEGVSMEELHQSTGAPLKIAADLRRLSKPPT
ncbi:3-oxoacid CoA-transferase subunit B [Variovorax sp. LjRoot178]|uniref:3-oxoacid CoA-transferase subunit B n=1 Tax=Variovorax sp. LjRoot178 TaxID=3342277 RepID=UPI003ECF62FE